MPKRKPNAKRKPCGRIAYEPASPDQGTPELQAKRLATLGKAATLLPLSHANPIDILTARGYLTAAQNLAAREYQRVHMVVFGPTHAQAIRLATRLDGEGLAAPMSARARLVAERQLDAWDRAVRRLGQMHRNCFSRYVIDEYADDGIQQLKDKRLNGANIGWRLLMIWKVQDALNALIDTPRVVVSDDEVEAEERVAA